MKPNKTGWWFQIVFVIFHPENWEKILILTHIFRRCWNHQLENMSGYSTMIVLKNHASLPQVIQLLISAASDKDVATLRQMQAKNKQAGLEMTHLDVRGLALNMFLGL